nr:glycosyltransferase family 4 protein [Candidatus Baldrarchaeota archaeon]
MSKDMKILFVIPYFYPAQAFGGSVQVAFNIGKELIKRGHEVTIFTSDAKDLKGRLNIKSSEIEGMKVYYFKNLSMFFARSSKLFITPELPRKIQSDLKSFDVIHTHEYRTYQNIIVHKYAKKYKVPYILQAHGSIARMGRTGRKLLYDILFGYRILKDASKVIALTAIEAEQYKAMGVSEDKIAILPNGIDLSEYKDLPTKGSFRRKYDINNEKKIILYLGRIHKIKGVDFLIKAYAYLVKKLKFNNTLLIIAGPDDGYLNEVKSLVKSLKIADMVLFTGPLTEQEKKSAFIDSSIVVCPEKFNVYLLVPLEAAACGTPVIVSKTNYIRYVVEKGGFGFSVNYGDATKLAELIKKMLNDESLLKEMGKRGRKFVFENYSWTNIIDELEKVYEEVINK